VETRHGLFLANPHDQYIGRALIEYGEFSEREWMLLAQLARPNAVIVEIGANIGAHAVSLAKAVGPGGHVVAIEPQPVVFQNLCANLALNGLTNVQAINAGCGEADASLSFPRINYTRLGNFGAIPLDRLPPDPNSPFRVPVRPLDALVDLKALHLIKIDVEGMEAAAIRGARGLIAAHRPFLYVENDRVEKSAELISLIESLGYRAWWHTPTYFNPENFAGRSDNIYGGIASVNMLCAPGERSVTVPDLKPVDGPDWHPLAKPAEK
jgi:FkbM family methyltransferase